MFDPTIGRWLTEDPEGFVAADPNLFRYCENDPTNEMDPSGLDAVPDSKSTNRPPPGMGLNDMPPGVAKPKATGLPGVSVGLGQAKGNVGAMLRILPLPIWLGDSTFIWPIEWSLTSGGKEWKAGEKGGLIIQTVNITVEGPTPNGFPAGGFHYAEVWQVMPDKSVPTPMPLDKDSTNEFKAMGVRINPGQTGHDWFGLADVRAKGKFILKFDAWATFYETGTDPVDLGFGVGPKGVKWPNGRPVAGGLPSMDLDKYNAKLLPLLKERPHTNTVHHMLKLQWEDRNFRLLESDPLIRLVNLDAR